MPDNIIQNVSIQGEGNIVVGKGDVIINPLPPAETRLRHELGILLKNVETTWINGVLEKSVHQAALLELGMELRDEAVDNPWRMVMEKPDQTREIVPQGKKIKDIFNEANRLLLILGEPGSGKTTTLLQLAKELIAEVDQTFTQPIPVILNLSTWTNKQQSLDEWLVAELNSKYHLPKKDGKKWLRDHRILPLLDGLDEVKVENRAICVEKINQLVIDYGLQGMVVCSRIKDYTELKVGLAFYRAIYIQPLTPEQVDEYLSKSGDKLASLHRILQDDADLLRMAQSPLVLNIMSLAYQNESAESLINLSLTTDPARYKHLFDTYISRMLNRKTNGQQYDNEQTKQRLSWVAKNLYLHGQEVFLLESLQPNWLQKRGLQWMYYLMSRIVTAIFIGLVLFLGESKYFNWTFSLLVMAIIGLGTGLFDAFRFELLYQFEVMRKIPVILWSVIRILVAWAIFGVGVLGVLRPKGDSLFVFLFFGLIMMLIFGLRTNKKNPEFDIVPVEALRWSWRKAFSGCLIAGIGGLFLGCVLGLYWAFRFSEQYYWLETAAESWLVGLPLFGVSFGLSGLVLSGLQREIIETKSKPNQGVWLTTRNTGIIGLLFGVIGLVVFLLPVYDADYSLLTLINTVFETMFLGIFLFGGIFDVIHHYVLRFILVITGYTPVNYAQFLDYATDHIFLQKVGGGYRFIHRLLLEHFAKMDTTSKSI